MGRIATAVFLAIAAAAASGSSGVRAETFHTCAGFIDSVPATIDAQGVWCLRRDLSTGIASGSAINITVNNVTIDCNGFKLGGLPAGDASQARGIRAFDVQNAAVRNCKIRGFAVGLHLDQGEGHLVEDNRFDNNLTVGISICCGSNNIVQRNIVYDTGGSTVFTAATGITALGHVRDNIVRGVHANGSGIARGISVGSYGSSIRDNEVYEILSNATGNSTAVGIYAYGNAQTIEHNIVLGLYAIPEGAPIGIHATEAGAQVVGNRLDAVNGGVYGIRGSSSDTICKDNTAVGFTTAFSSCEVSEGNLSSP